MSKKHKKDNKDRKYLHQTTADEDIAKGKAFLEKGKARDAIDALKLSEKKNGTSDSIRQLLFRAYLLREDQLRSKGLIREADAINKLAFGLMPAADCLTEADVLAYVSHASVRDSLALYINFSKSHSPSARIDQHLVYRLMITDDWEPLEMLDISHPLRCDSLAVKKAVSLMNQANWEDALLALKAISRVSPFAPIRLFCRAMVLFYQENDSEILHILSLIPEDFPLASCVESLKQGVGGKDPFSNASQPHSQIQCLWEGTANPEKLVTDILNCLKSRQMKQAAFHISSFAKAIFPHSQIFAIQQILEALLFSSYHKGRHEIGDLMTVINTMLPERLTDLLLAKIHLEISLSPQHAADAYLSLLEKEIPDTDYRNMVSGMILLSTANKLNSKKTENRFMEGTFPHFSGQAGWFDDNIDSDQVILNLVVNSIELDPMNLNAYELLINIPRYSRDAKEEIESALLKMSAVFPDNPFPCLELATLYYEKNAFRKAEHVLKEAAKRAPHDNRVMDRLALSLVISACKNLHRGKHHLVLADLEKAEGFNSKKIAPLLAEKKALLELVTNPDLAEKIIFKNFSSMSPVDRIRTMGILVQDAQAYGKPIISKHIKMLENHLIKELKKLTLNSADIITLLSLFPKEYKPVLPQNTVAHIILSKRSDFFGVIPDADLISAFELLFHKDILGFMADELQKRLRKKNQPKAVQMLFFLITLRHMTGFSYCSERYIDALAMADDATRSELEALSGRLSRQATGFLRSSLEHFDFSALDGTIINQGFSGFQYPDFDEDDFDETDDLDDADDLEDLINEVAPFLDEVWKDTRKKDKKEMINTIEELVDSLNIRGLPEGEILNIRNHFRSIPQIQKIFDSMGEIVKVVPSTDLSREAKILLSGKKQQQLSLF